MEVESGSGTSFTYTHPTPAEYRRLEWQWKPFTGVGTVIRLFKLTPLVPLCLSPP